MDFNGWLNGGNICLIEGLLIKNYTTEENLPAPLVLLDFEKPFVTSHAKTFPTTSRSESRSREVAVKSP